MLVVFNKENNNKEEEDYNVKNIDKALGHVHRAGFDALDGTVVSLKYEIVQILAPYDIDIITEVMPDYWMNKQKINDISAKVGELRGAKDAGGAELVEIFSAYVEEINDLRTIHKEIN